MPTVRQAPHEAIVAGTDLRVLAESFERHLRAEGKSPRTITHYLAGVAALSRFLQSRGMPLHVEGVSGEHVREFMADLLSRQKASTAHARYRGLQAFFAWLLVEGEIKDTPLKNLKPPRLPQEQPPVLTEDQLRALLRTCEKGDFTSRRDTALVRLMADTGARLSEVLNLRWQPGNPKENDVDFGQALMRIRHGKGDKERIVHLGNKTLRALDRYLRKRATHRNAALPWLWLAPKGRLSPSGLQQLLLRRGAEANIPGRLHPHIFRHTAAHYELLAGAPEVDVMRQMGWTSRDMVARYAASAGQERSWASHEKFGLGDRL